VNSRTNRMAGEQRIRTRFRTSGAGPAAEKRKGRVWNEKETEYRIGTCRKPTSQRTRKGTGKSYGSTAAGMVAAQVL